MPDASPQLILASTSPRRRALLTLLQIPFTVEEPGFEEEAGPSSGRHAPRTQALRYAEGKAAACAASHPDALVLACDTLIDLDGRALGKPQSRDDARAMLQALSGREHLVHSAVVLRQDRAGGHRHGVESVRVRMRPAACEAIERYLASGEWAGKAGAYAIQGAGGSLIESIDGDYPAVVGLPLRLVAELLRPSLVIPVDVDSLYRFPPDPNWVRFSR